MVEDYNLSKLQVLVLEQNFFMRRLLSGILMEFNFQKIRSVSKAEDAFNYFQNNPVDIIFSDWVPGGEETAFLHDVRTRENSVNKFVPIIIVSAFNEVKYVKLARDLGMNEYLALPISAQTMYRHICSVIERPRSFVQCTDYFGPDRRRHSIPFEGDEKRLKDSNEEADDESENEIRDNTEDVGEA